jgi:hypothetical protein
VVTTRMDDDLLVDLLNSYDSDEVSRFTDDGRTSSRLVQARAVSFYLLASTYGYTKILI